MKRNVFLCAAMLLFSGILQAQEQHGFRVSFADKTGTKDINSPLSFLSQRSLARRTAQGIAVNNSDLPVSPVYVDNVLQLTGGKLHLTSRWFNFCVVLVDDSSSILQLQNKPFITGIEYIARYPAGLHRKMTDENEKFSSEQSVVFTPQSQNKTSGSEAFYGMAYVQTSVVNGDYLHDRSYMGQGKLIAVCDEGFQFVDTNPGFDSLMRSGRLVDQYNFPRANTNVFVQGTHGTASLSTMAGYMPGSYVGAAPLAQYALYNTEFPGEQPIEMDQMVAAMERADSIGADIITVSLGYNEFEAPIPYKFSFTDIDGHTTLAAKGANMANAKGMLFVASAGNEGAGSWKNILTPGDADSALTVGSVDMNENPASSSGFGPNASGQVKPEVCLVGQPAIILDFNETPRAANGTSFATPQLAGWAACLWQATSNANPSRIRRAIVESASLFNNPQAQLGYGIPDFGIAVDLLDIKDTPGLPSSWVVINGNPAGDVVSLYLNQTHTGDVQFRISDMSGRVLYRESRKIVVGNQLLSLPAAHLPSGMYFLSVLSDNRQAVMKLVKS